MANRKQNESIKKDDKPSEKALLAEYQACQHDNSSSAQTYWTLTGIFIGFSTALLGGLIYGVISNNQLFQALLNVITQQEKVEPIETKQVFAAALIMILLSVAILLILWFLKGWLKRGRFIMQLNFERMREIEVLLEMQKSLRVHGIDNINNCDKLTDEEKAKLESYEKKKWCQDKRASKKYELPSSRWHYRGIFSALFALWSIVLLIGLITLCNTCCIALWITLGVLALIFTIIFLCRKCALRSNP